MNYNEIVEATKAYTDRFDTEVSNNIDTFIRVAESKINRLLKTREQTKRAYILTVTDQEYYVLPPDYRGLRDIQLNTDLPQNPHQTLPMTYINPEQMNVRRNQIYGGKLYYTIISNQIHIYPCQESGKSFEIVYYQKVPALTVTNANNWLSDEYPDIYIAGINSEIEYFVKNYAVAKEWAGRMALAIDELDFSDEEERWSGAPLQMRTDRNV